jgi:hypothetical protein
VERHSQYRNSTDLVINGVQTQLSDLVDYVDNHAQYKDTTSFVVGGDSDKWYPVVFPIQQDGKLHKIVIYRKYFEQAPKNDPNWNNSPSHFGQLYVEIDHMHRMWGGAQKVLHVKRNVYTYTPSFGKAELDPVTGYNLNVWLKGGGALYHVEADMPVNRDEDFFCKPLLVETQYYDHDQDRYDQTIKWVEGITPHPMVNDD